MGDTFVFEDDGIGSPTIFKINANTLEPNMDNPELLVVYYVDANNGICKFGWLI